MKNKHKKHEAEGSASSPEAVVAATAAASAGDPAPAGGAGDSKSDERFLRLMADFDNFRKRTQRERSEIYQQAHADLVAELLPVIDTLELALRAAAGKDPADAVVAGFRLVAEQLAAAIRKLGVTPIDAEGKPFDPAVHEAAAALSSDTVPEGHVMSETRKGYLLGSRLLRPSQVVVSSGVPKPEPAAEAPAPNEG